MSDDTLNQTSMSVEQRTNSLLGRMFRSCESDPRGSVHRAWGLTLVFIVIYFSMVVTETVNLRQNDGTVGLMIACIWVGLVHLALGVLGTFVLKRFPTSFSIGFLLGVLVVLANQNLLLFSAFSKYRFGNLRSNAAFAAVGMVLSMVLTVMALMLVHFKETVVISPMDETMMNDPSMDTSKQDQSYVSYDQHQKKQPSNAASMP